MFKHFRFTTFTLVVIYCVMSISSILMVHHLNLSVTLSQMGTGSFGQSYAYISVENSPESDKMIVQSLDRMAKDYAVCLDDTESDGSTTRFIFFDSKYATFPMQEGRFFLPSDFYEGNNVAVIGNGFEEFTYYKDGQRYISLAGVEYSILGIIGYDDDTLLDSYVFLNYYSDLEKKSKAYLLDFFSTHDAAYIGELCAEELMEQGIDSEMLTMGERFSESIMPKIHVVRWLLALLASCIISILLVSIEWVKSYKDEVCIRRLVGAPISSEILRLVIRYLVIGVIAFLVGLAYCIFLQPDYIRFLVIGFGAIIPFLLVFLGYTIYRILNVSIGEAIK